MGKVGVFVFSFVFSVCLFAQDFESAVERLRKSESLYSRLKAIREVTYEVKTFEDLTKFTRLIFLEFISKIPADFNMDEVEDRGEELIQLCFETRLRVNAFLNDYQKEIDPEKLRAISDFQRLLRGIEDLIGEYSLHSEKLTPKLAFQGGEPFKLWNPKYQGLSKDYVPQSGDVIVTRGVAVSSAAISRMGDRDGQFTHQSLVYVDRQGKVWTLESHIEVGNDIFKWKEFVEKKARAVVFRHRNPEFGPKAAEYMYRMLREAKLIGRKIPYDFKLKLNDNKELYCSELVHVGYEAVGAPILNETFYNSLTKLGKKTLRQLGVEARTFIAPADMELDPNFEVVVEWRDFAKTQKTRQHDAIMTALYDLIENNKYAFTPTTGQNFLVAMLKIFRVFPLTHDIFSDKFPTNIPNRTMALLLVLDKIVKQLAEEIEEFDKTYFEASKAHATLPVMEKKTKEIILDPTHAVHKKIARYFKVSRCAVELMAEGT